MSKIHMIKSFIKALITNTEVVFLVLLIFILYMLYIYPTNLSTNNYKGKDSEIVRWYWREIATGYNMSLNLYFAGAVTLAIGLLAGFLMSLFAGLLLSVPIAVIFFFLGNRSYKRFKKVGKEFAKWKVKNEQA